AARGARPARAGRARSGRSRLRPAVAPCRRAPRRLPRRLPQAREGADPAIRIPPRERLGYVSALGTGRRACLEGHSYLLSSGTRAALPEASPLAREPWLAVTDVTRSSSRQARGTAAIIRAAAPI